MAKIIMQQVLDDARRDKTKKTWQPHPCLR